jgi:hypothetical protein
MGPRQWSCWTKWNTSVKRTLDDAQRDAAGDDSIAEARERAGASGTCSVLDVYALGERAPDVTWALSAREMQQYFGSKTPTKKAIVAGVDSLLAKLGGGASVAVTAYTRGMPSAVLFAGRTIR